MERWAYRARPWHTGQRATPRVRQPRVRACGFAILLSACQPAFTCPPDAGPGVVFPPRQYVCERATPTPCALSEPSESEEARTVCVREELDGVTLAYVIDIIRVPVPRPSDSASIGFD